MNAALDGAHPAASLAARLAQLAFVDLTADEVTTRIIDTVLAWGGEQGWRVYRRAPSVLPLPPPLSAQHSVIDVACARPTGPPVVVEVDRTDRRRTVEKLLAEAAAGRTAIWVRWGTGPFAAAPPPVHLVTCEVTRRNGPPGRGRLHSRTAGADRPPPAHSPTGAADGAAEELPMPFPEVPKLIYKILLPAEWAAFQAAGHFDGSPFDTASGFVHCSAREQVAATAVRFFGAEPTLVIVALDAGLLGANVRWERASDDGVFPHVYASLPIGAVRSVHEVAGAAAVDAALAVAPPGNIV